jgi:hypothetical protein
MFFAMIEVEEKAKTPANLQLFTPVVSTWGFTIVEKLYALIMLTFGRYTFLPQVNTNGYL